MADTAFDYIVVGAGAAGCVLANRLSADPGIRVAIVEAGPSDRKFPVNLRTMVPVGNIFLLAHARFNWQFSFSGGPGVQGREIPCPRGKLMGGCTSINGTVYMRGHPSDYDEWAALGNGGWGFKDVLPAYKTQEHYRGAASNYHGSTGDLDVQRPAESNPLAHAFVAAAVEAGHARNEDFNGPGQDGFGIFDLNQRDGVRLSSSRAFLRPASRRANLQIFADTMVERIILDGKRARGVVISSKSERLELTASSEIIVAAGTINTPQLLLLSGIGPTSGLAKHNIAVAHELRGVGANLQDHPTISIAVSNPGGESYALSWQTAPRVAMAPLRYLLGRKGLLASNAAEAGGFMRSHPELTRPDIQMTIMVGLKENARTMPRRHGFVVHIAVLRPRTRGHLELRSKDPAAKPLMYPRFLEDRADLVVLIAGVREARRILAMPAIARYAGGELSPGAAVNSDEQLEAYIRANVATTYHPVGTCKMGPASDPMAVVDERLRVHGLVGLRVADASIMPNIVGGNTSAPSMMIGERAAAFIRHDGIGVNELVRGEAYDGRSSVRMSEAIR